MKSEAALCSPLEMGRSRLADLIALTKPRIALMVLFTVGVGAFLAQPGTPDFMVVLHAVVGTGLLAAGASVLNQVFERHTDALMRRTEQRPLASGRLHPLEGLLLGLALSSGGIAYLALMSKHVLAVWLGVFTLLSYVFIYTPLKRHTTLNTLVGAVPGALPPVIGWAAVTGSVDAPALVLFLVLFLWQVPHFLAIAWIYREDYARAGLKMLPAKDPEGKACGKQMALYCVTLIPVGLVPLFEGWAGWLFAVGAVGLGLVFLRASLGFVREASNQQARKVLHASLLYLPALLALWLADHWLIVGR